MAKKTTKKKASSKKPEGYIFGRPTKYKPEYVKKLIEYIERDFTRVKTKEVVGKDGVTVLTEEVANYLPTIEEFAHIVGVDTDTIGAWSKKYPDFLGAIKKLKEMQKRMLLNNGLLGDYDKTMAIFILKCNHGFKEHEGDNDTQVNVYV